MNPFSKPIVRRLALYGTGLLVALVLCLPLVVNRLANTGFAKQTLSNFIFDQTGLRIPDSGFTLSIFPSTGLKVDAFTVGPELTGIPFEIHIEQLQVELDPNQLLNRKLYVSQITVRGPSIRKISQPPSGDTRLPGKNLFQGLEKIMDSLLSALAVYQPELDLIIRDISSKFVKTMDARINLSVEKQRLLVDLQARDLVFDSAAYPHIGLSDQAGFNASTLRLPNADLILTLDRKGELTGRFVTGGITVQQAAAAPVLRTDSLNGRFHLTPKLKTVLLKPVTLISPAGQVGLSFKSTTGPKGAASILFSGAGIHIGAARKTALDLFPQNDVIVTIFDILLDGKAEQIQVSFQSEGDADLFDEDRMVLSGTVSDGRVAIPETHLVATGVNGSADISGGVLEVNADSGMLKGTVITKGHLFVDLLNYKDYPFNGTFDLDTDLSQVPPVLAKLLENSLLGQEMGLVRSASGRADAVLTLEMKTGEALPDVRVSARNVVLEGRYDRIPDYIRISSLDFSYADDRIRLDRLSAEVMDSRLEGLEADIDLENEPLIRIGSASGTVNLDRIFPWLLSFERPRQILSPVKSAGGQIDVSSLFLAGPVLEPENWQFTLKGKAVQVNASTSDSQDEVTDLFCDFSVSDHSTLLDGARFNLITVPFTEPFIQTVTAQSIRLPIAVSGGIFHHAPDQVRINLGLTFPDGPFLEMALSGTSLTELGLDRVGLTDKPRSHCSIDFTRDYTDPHFKLTGNLDTQSIERMLVKDSVLAERLAQFTDRQTITVESDHDNTLHLDLERIDLGPLLSRKSFQDMERLFLPSQPLVVSLEKMTLEKLEFARIQSRISLKRDHSYIRISQADLCGITLNGFLNFKDSQVMASIPFDTQKELDCQELFRCLMNKDRFMDGSYTFKGTLNSQGPQGSLLDQMGGEFHFYAKQGRIYKLTLLSRILSVLNVSNLFKGNIPNVLQTGFAYQSVEIQADIKAGKIHLNRAVIDGNDMTLIFRGWVDPVNDQLELTCLVAPFKTIDLIVKYIPIVNTMLGGRLVSVPVKATGKLSDPQVIPLHPSAVGQGLINMMGDILKTPVKLIDKIASDDDSEADR